MHLVNDLWLPILISAVAVFGASSLLHMVLPIHRSDYRRLPDEESVLDALRAHQLGPGAYLFPFPSSMQDMSSDEMQEKYRRGPVGWLTVLPNGPPAIGRSLVMWLLYVATVSVVVGYVAMLGLDRGTEFMLVFRVTSTTALLAYSLGEIPNLIWKGARFSTTVKSVLDGVVYSLATGLVFALLWP